MPLQMYDYKRTRTSDDRDGHAGARSAGKGDVSGTGDCAKASRCRVATVMPK